MLVAETKALISFSDIAKLICAFVFAYSKCWFSHFSGVRNSVINQFSTLRFKI